MISAVVVTHKSGLCICRCLAWLREHLPGAELVVVDNASNDASAELARVAGARVVELSHNIGFGRGCNAGVETASGEHILFVNPDVTLISVADKELELDDLLTRRPFGLAAGKLVDATGALAWRATVAGALVALRSSQPHRWNAASSRSAAAGAAPRRVA